MTKNTPNARATAQTGVTSWWCTGPMEHTQMPTKEAALSSLGVHTKRDRWRLATKVEFVTVAARRRLVKEGHFFSSVLVGLDGSATLRDAHGHVETLEAPFVIDFWGADEARRAVVEAVADTAATLLLVDWTHRDAVFTAIPRLRRLSRETEERLANADAVVEADTHASRTVAVVS